MLNTCENWLGLVNSWVYYARQIHDIYQVLPYLVDFKALLSKVVFSKCSFIWNKELVHIWNDRKAQKLLVHRTYIFSIIFDTATCSATSDDNVGIMTTPLFGVGQCTGLFLQEMAWHLLVAKPLSEQMLTHCQLDY